MKPEMNDMNVKNLCSRKLFELCTTSKTKPAELAAIVEELQHRRHYLDRLPQVVPSQMALSPFAQHH